MNSELPLIPISKPDSGPDEETAVLRVLRSGFLAQGSEVPVLENEFAAAIGVEHAVAVANGTAALHVAAAATSIRTSFPPSRTWQLAPAERRQGHGLLPWLP